MTRNTGGDAGADAYQEALGRAIKVRRTELGLSRKELAELAGISYPYLADIESGRRRASSSALVGVARGLGMTLSSLLAWAERYLEEGYPEEGRLEQAARPRSPAAHPPEEPRPAFEPRAAEEPERLALAHIDAPGALEPAPLEPPSRRMFRRRGLGRWGVASLVPPEREGVDEVRAARREPRGMLRTSAPPEAEEASLASGAGELRQQLHRLVELLRPEDLPLAASLLRRLLRGAPER